MHFANLRSSRAFQHEKTGLIAQPGQGGGTDVPDEEPTPGVAITTRYELRLMPLYTTISNVGSEVLVRPVMRKKLLPSLGFGDEEIPQQLYLF